MSQQIKLIGYSPYKAARHGGGRNDPRIAEAWERAKTEAPNLYRKHTHMKAFCIAEGFIIDAMLDDPEIITLIAELENKAAHTKQQALGAELALLGIASAATKREVRNAYRRQARKLHPDVGGDDATFKRLHAAYRRLLATVNE